MELCESPIVEKLEPTVKTEEVKPKPKDSLAKEEAIKPEGLKVLYKEKTLLESEDNYTFQSEGLLDLSPKVIALHESLQDFLKKNPDKQLKITGQYFKDENNPTKFDNLGLARADQIAQTLIKEGVNAQQVLTYIETKDQLPLLDKKYYGGATLEIIDKPIAKIEEKKREEPFKLSKEEENLIFSKQNVYFDLASSYATINEAYIQLLIKYLKSNPSARVKIDGHTDSLGDKAKNVTLSQQRAENVKNQLIQRGIDSKKLITKGEGQNKPVADNNTEAGRSKNRRVEIIIQK
ncbi:MAG: OmpA family protein [Microscillaceae bacterium]|nr:OmpA family protein [Microscillaceae bacterium]